MTVPDKSILSNLVNFGRDAAEQEDTSDFLVNHFVQTDAYKEAIEGSKSIIIGRKGAGKSAIFLFLKRNKAALATTEMVFVVPEDVSASRIRGFVGKGINEQASKTLVWRYLFLTLIARFLVYIAKTELGDEKNWSDDLRRIRKFLVDNDEIDDLDMMERFRKFASRIQPDSLTIKLSAIGEVAVGKNKDVDTGTQLVSGIDRLEKLI